MAQAPLQVTRLSHTFASDDRRVMARFFSPGEQGRCHSVIDRVLALSEQQVEQLLDRVLQDFNQRHRDISAVFAEHFEMVCPQVPANQQLSRTRQLLIGAYFTMEYAIESAALFNPSIVESPQQEGLPPGAVRFLMSLRATGEGHVSSIVFRLGIINQDNTIQFDPVSRFSHRLKVVEDHGYDRKLFTQKLVEMGAYNHLAGWVLAKLPESFSMVELDESIEQIRNELEEPQVFQEMADNMTWLARSNYQLEAPAGVDPSEVVIFPTSENESRGIEDVRLVCFTEEDGSVYYYGTYTAYNGFRILPQLIETTDFRTIKIHTLNGQYAQNKGLALFPRKVQGWYMMISRLDGENLFLMRSDNVRFWNDAQVIQTPKFTWEFVQIGNCGSPIETDAGWLLLTHGVGPVRQYCIGASLLDLDDPSRVIGQLADPLLVPTDEERDGYVPNVVYTCGAMVHNGMVVIPYATSDSATTFATVPLDQLLERLTN